MFSYGKVVLESAENLGLGLIVPTDGNRHSFVAWSVKILKFKAATMKSYVNFKINE